MAFSMLLEPIYAGIIAAVLEGLAAYWPTRAYSPSRCMGIITDTAAA